MDGIPPARQLEGMAAASRPGGRPTFTRGSRRHDRLWRCSRSQGAWSCAAKPNLKRSCSRRSRQRQARLGNYPAEKVTVEFQVDRRAVRSDPAGSSR